MRSPAVNGFSGLWLSWALPMPMTSSSTCLAISPDHLQVAQVEWLETANVKTPFNGIHSDLYRNYGP